MDFPHLVFARRIPGFLSPRPWAPPGENSPGKVCGRSAHASSIQFGAAIFR